MESVPLPALFSFQPVPRVRIVIKQKCQRWNLEEQLDDESWDLGLAGDAVVSPGGFTRWFHPVVRV